MTMKHYHILAMLGWGLKIFSRRINIVRSPFVPEQLLTGDDLYLLPHYFNKQRQEKK
jgi:hypothetical protein